jgi:SAM-dependent methyltransferase
MLKKALNAMYAGAMALNDRNVCDSLTENGPFDRILDVGCWDGEKTMKYAKAAGALHVDGIEIVPAMAEAATRKGIRTIAIRADVDSWPYPDATFPCVISNQVIEHLSDVDRFIGEAARVLKPGGVLVTSTNNLSSWHNIVSLAFGWAPFDLTNSSALAVGIGNPLALHKGEPPANGASWCHKCVFTSRWLEDWFSLYGLERVSTLGAGYYPFPSRLGRLLPTHSAFITVVARKRP